MDWSLNSTCRGSELNYIKGIKVYNTQFGVDTGSPRAKEGFTPRYEVYYPLEIPASTPEIIAPTAIDKSSLEVAKIAVPQTALDKILSVDEQFKAINFPDLAKAAQQYKEVMHEDITTPLTQKKEMPKWVIPLIALVGMLVANA